MNPSAKSESTIEPRHDVADPRLVAAVAAAQAAGDVSRRYFGTGIRVEWKGEGASRSAVTAADREAEEAARAVIGTHFPAHGFLGEEFGETGSREARWILDPIDGTQSFIHGVPLYSTLIGVEVDGSSQVGVAYFPALDEMVSAAHGLGARWNGRPCRVSTTPSLADATLCYTSIDGFLRTKRRE
ncbi:MAG TPA: inositol monophosphatase family protein, partial [Candidatus Udaeobacter sp.]|nr:inositol monophosphatase family protein [Candidatus Udaeobacter sp.]